MPPDRRPPKPPTARWRYAGLTAYQSDSSPGVRSQISRTASNTARRSIAARSSRVSRLGSPTPHVALSSVRRLTNLSSSTVAACRCGHRRSIASSGASCPEWILILNSIRRAYTRQHSGGGETGSRQAQGTPARQRRHIRAGDPPSCSAARRIRAPLPRAPRATSFVISLTGDAKHDLGFGSDG
jgi:hypothetical protein